MKKFILLFLFVLAQAKNLDAVVAVINDTVITQSDLAAAIKQEQAFGAKVVKSEQVLDLLVEEAILVQQAKLMQIKIEPSELQQILENFAKSNNQTVDSLKEVLASQGQTLSDFKARLEHQVLAKRVLAALMTPKQRPSKASVEAYYQKHKADGVMLSFADRVFSKEVPENWRQAKPTKIPMTFVKALPPQYQSAILQNPFANEYGPIKTDNGYHMVIVEGWQGQLMPKNYALNVLMLEALDRAKPEIIQQIKKNIYIQVKK